MRLLLLLLLVIVVVLLWSLWRRAQARARVQRMAGDRYRVLETTSGSEAHVFIGATERDSRVLIGSVPIASEEFDERYAELIVQAEDRAASLNASRQLHPRP